jgi:hypothetical protein
LSVADLRHELELIWKEHQELTAALVVDLARDEGHPLHASFEWDDAKAGESFRLSQARQMIRSVKITYRTDDGKSGNIRHWYSVDRGQSRSYEPADEIVQDDVALAIVLRDMEREWKTLKRKYDRFGQFRDMVLKDLG